MKKLDIFDMESIRSYIFHYNSFQMCKYQFLKNTNITNVDDDLIYLIQSTNELKRLIAYKNYDEEMEKLVHEQIDYQNKFMKERKIV